MVIFLYGLDSYRSRQKLNRLKEKFKKEVDPSGVNIITLEGQNLISSPEESLRLRQEILSPGFLSRRRMIIIEDLLNQSNGKKIKDELLELLKNREQEESNIIVFWERGEIKEKSRLLFALKQKKYVEEFRLLSVPKLREWIKEEIKRRNSQIEEGAVDLLISYVANNLWQMAQEINKLAAFKNPAKSGSPVETDLVPRDALKDKKITVQDVKLLVKSKLDENIFHLVDAVGNKNTKLALKLLSDQLKTGAGETYLLSMLARQFRILIQIKELAREETRLTQEKIVSFLDLHPFVVRKALSEAQNFTLEELKNIYQKILELDIKLKTQDIKPEALFDLFLTTLSEY